MRIIKSVSNCLTAAFLRGILNFMNTKTMTPEIWDEFDKKMDEVRQARDNKIRELRKQDPVYWTYERLAKEWNMSKQNVDYIINGNPRKKKE